MDDNYTDSPIISTIFYHLAALHRLSLNIEANVDRLFWCGQRPIHAHSESVCVCVIEC